jgi:tripartite-type tricarboxylate transporter receptor subunit TctC
MRLVASCLVAGATLLGAPSAVAQSPFYQGKQVTMFVNFAPGGPTDIEARLFTRSIARHIAGKPGLIVQNMDGAGGMAGANYLGEVAPHDGTVIGFFSSVAWLYTLSPSQRRVAFDKYDFVSYQPGTAIHYMRTDVKPGIRSVDQIQTAEDLVVGGLSFDNAKDIMMRLTLDMLGVKYKYVTSYKGSQGVRLALQRGEVNYYAESPATYRSVIAPSMVQQGEAIPLYYDPGYDGQTFSFPKQMEGLDIPSFMDVYRKLKRQEPSGRMWQAYLAALTVNNALQRIVVLPPNSPPAAIAALQEAIHAMQKDPAYIADANKAFGYVPDYVAAPGTNQTIRKALNIDAELKTYLHEYMKSRPR